MSAETASGFSVTGLNGNGSPRISGDANSLPPDQAKIRIGFDREKMLRDAQQVWANLPRLDDAPSASALRQMIDPPIRLHTVLFEFSRLTNEVTIPFFGSEIARSCGLSTRTASISEAPHDSVLARLPIYFPQVADTLAPVGFSDLAATGLNGEARFCGVLLPFQEVAGHLSHVAAIVFASEHDEGAGDHILELTELDAVQLEEFGEDDPEYRDSARLEKVYSAIAERALANAAMEAEDDTSLAALLGAARESAREALDLHTRSRRSLYRALGKAYAFVTEAERQPDEYAALLSIAGIAVQDRAPLTPIVKLVFGKDYDRTRLAEYASVLACAVEDRIPVERFEEFVLAHPGGIKGIVQKHRQRGEKPAIARRPRRKVRAAAARRFRNLRARPISSLSTDGEEFAVVLIRRLDDGTAVVLGEISDDAATVERIGNRLLDQESADGQTD